MSDQRRQQVSDHVRQLIAAIADGDTDPDAASVLIATGQALAARPLPHRNRAGLHQIAAAVRSYLTWLTPDGFELASADETLEWHRPDGTVLVDLIHPAAYNHAAVPVPIRKHAEAIVDEHRPALGEKFAGVRVIPLAAPARSRLIDGRGRASTALSETDWWKDHSEKEAL